MAGDLMDYLKGLDDDELMEAIAAIPIERRKQLVVEFCADVNNLVERVVKDPEHLWLTGELPPEEA